MRTLRPAPSSLLRYSPLAAALATALVPAMAATYSVTTTLDSGAGSLRQAMQDAVGACDTDAQIQFNIPGPFVISPSFALPGVPNCDGVQTKVTIDGTTQPGASLNTAVTGFNANNVIAIDGGPGSYFDFNCPLRTENFGYGEGTLAIKGLHVRNFTYGGFTTAICGKVLVTGSEVYANDYGIDADHGSVIGGPTPAERNIIRNSTYDGIAGSFGRVDVINNYIGTDSSGTVAQPNGLGIYVIGGSGNVISGNVISGNAWGGLSISEGTGMTVANNAIGTNAARDAALANGFGIDAQCLSGGEFNGNVVSGNFYGGMYFSLADNVQIIGNKVGVAGDGVSQLPNNGEGVYFDFGGFCGAAAAKAKTSNRKAAVAGGSNNLNFGGNTVAYNTGSGLALMYGGDADISGNAIHHNGNHGIALQVGTGNRISGNAIYGNVNKNIDLDFYGGPLPNDDELSPLPVVPPDQDTGPNERQNHPVVQGVIHDLVANSTAVTWVLRSTPSTTFAVEFFSNSASGTPAGGTYLPTPASAVTDGSGFYFTTTTLPGLHDNIAMTAIDPLGNTSEFSAAVALTPTPAVQMNPASPATLSFGNAVVGTSTLPQTVTLLSAGTAPYVINAFGTDASCYGGPICSSGSFTCLNACTPLTQYGNGNSCSINVSFTPSVIAPGSETFYICDNAPGSPRQVTLTGNGVAPPPPTIAPTGHNFGSFQSGTFSASQTFTFNNPAPVAVTISSVTISGPFQIVANGCAGTIANGASCTVDARFAPIADGAASGVLSVAASSGTANAALSGSGTPVPPATMAPASHDFGTIVVGLSSPITTFTITNPAATPLALSLFTVSPPFALDSTTCTSSLPPTSSCEARVKFSPSAPGPASGTISATAGFGTISSGLIGNGAATAAITLAPAGHDFGTLLVGQEASHVFRVTNPASTVVTLSPPSATPPFQVSGTTCTSSLAPTSTCTVTAKFIPVANGTVSGVLSVSGSSGNPSSTLVGTGLLQPVLEAPAGPIDLGNGVLGGPSLSQVLTLRNAGNAALSIERISIGAPFTVVNACPINLLPGATCAVTIELQPNAIGTFSGSLTLVTNAPGGSRAIAVRAQVQARPEPLVRVTPVSIGFGARMGGTQSPPQRVSVVNEGGADATGLALAVNNPHFVILNTSCGPVLGPQQTCFADLAFQPIGFGPKQATLSVSSTAPTVGVSLSGAGCRPPQPTQGRGSRLNCAP